jgi:hypothetical protein
MGFRSITRQARRPHRSVSGRARRADLPASTNPLEVFEAADAVANGARPSEETAAKWDPSIQALLSFPTVLKMMRDKIDWTTQLGKAFAADQGGVLAAIQHVRQQAHSAGNLKSNDKQVVTTQGSTIVIEPASPDIIYVPQYNPVTVIAPAPYYVYEPMMTFGVDSSPVPRRHTPATGAAAPSS